ncbi:hypothetical protein HYH03_011278 [Edaphochlamys debaryana]|uniref:Uncharacterized protein n=1 Tax=Edaphochlamys debaryana TaxID=47281 RepID=A0A836BWP4_9CHLO|nr:hypothetical protein HYH03_011278 [Edaphochlamys debaryana]|eukprot:KAG2490329.1 hypothetical protein HYH03_011278 [Edaphochlamys debaryana]
MSSQQPKKDSTGRQFLARIAAGAEEDPQKAQAFLAGAHRQYVPGQDPVKPLTPEEEKLWKDYSLNFARRLNKM